MIRKKVLLSVPCALAMVWMSSCGDSALELRGSSVCHPPAGTVETWCDGAGSCEYRVANGAVFTCGSPEACATAEAQALESCRAGGAVDGGMGDGGPQPDALELTIEAFSWDRARWAVHVRLANGTSSSASLTPELFGVRTDAGVEFLGRDPIGDHDGLRCAADRAVPPGSSAACWVEFLPEAGDPVSVSYRAADGRTASAEVPQCVDGADGYCAPGLVCMAHGCDVQCSFASPSGFCADGLICDGGFCRAPRAPCGPGEPDGFCENGTCFDSRCVVGTVHCSGEGVCMQNHPDEPPPALCDLFEAASFGDGPCPGDGARCRNVDGIDLVFDRSHADYDAADLRMTCEAGLGGDWTP